MKKIILFITTICLAVVFIAVGIWLINSNNSKVEQPPFMVDPVQENNKMKLSTKRYVDTRTGETGVTINATVNPISVVNDKLTWTLEWATVSSENVSDYVTMNVSADTHSVILTYKKNFNTQLVLKATSVQTPSVTATCNIDCYERTSDFTIAFDLGMESGAQTLPVDETTKKVNFSVVTYSELNNMYFEDFVSEDALKVGTIETVTSTITKISLSNGLKTKLTSAGIVFDSTQKNLSTFLGKTIQGGLDQFIDLSTNDRDKVYEVLGQIDTWFDLEVTLVDTYQSTEINRLTKVYKLSGFNISDGLSVTDINFNKNNIIF